MDREDALPGVRPGDHLALFYRSPGEFDERVGGHLLRAVQGGGTAIMVGTPEHRRSVARWLAGAGADVAAAAAHGSYLSLDASETLRRFMAAGWPDPAGFWLAVSPLIRQAAGRGGPVHVFGEMVALLWDSGLVEAAIEVEAMWNELGGQYPFTLLCGYPAESAGGDRHHDALAEVCRLHAAAEGAPPG